MAHETASPEAILEPTIPIVDAHHHFQYLTPSQVADLTGSTDWLTAQIHATLRATPRYLFDDLMADLTCGHNVRATVYSDNRAMYRQDGPPELQSVGEVEFVNGMAAMGASGQFGDVRPCAGIVGNVDLRLGERVDTILEAHMRAGGGRYRGVRMNTFFDPDPALRRIFDTPPGMFQDSGFRSGFSRLNGFGLSCDLAVWEPQLGHVAELASAFADTSIVLNHAGMPLGVAGYKGTRKERFPIWREAMHVLSKCHNVSVKLGGFGTVFAGSPFFRAQPPASSRDLAVEWRPYVETCIALFGVERCMFESNFPVDGATCTYPVLWNAFKRIVADYTADEKTALFGGSAIKIYRLEL